MCFVMELCPGGDLFSYIKKRRRLKENQAKYFFAQILKGLDAIHKQQILHRDIKLENIMIDATGSVKIGDFGVSRRLKAGELCFEQCGTPAYIAPELLGRKGYCGYLADLWSAGVCLYAMIVGSVPFKASTISQLHKLICEGTFSFEFQSGSHKKTSSKSSKSLFSDNVKDLISKLLCVNPLKRLSAEEALKHPWFKDVKEVMQDIFTEKEKAIILKDYHRLKIEERSFTCADRVETDVLLTEHPLDT